MKAKRIWAILLCLVMMCGFGLQYAYAEEDTPAPTETPTEEPTETPTEAPTRTPSPTEPPPWYTEEPSEDPDPTETPNEVYEGGVMDVGPIAAPSIKVGKKYTFSFPLTYVTGMKRITTEQQNSNGVYSILGYLDFLELTPIISDGDSFPFEIDRTDYSQRIIYPEGKGVIVNKERYEDTLRLKDNLTNGTYPVYFKARYREVDTKDIQETEIRLFINVTGAKTESDGSGSNGGGSSGGGDVDPSQPRLMISGSSTNPEAALAGSNFVLTLLLHNTSTTQDIKNIQVTFANTEEEDYILPDSGSSTVYIPKIEKDQVYEQKITMAVRADAPEKVHQLTVKMDYEDTNSSPISTEAGISITVKQEVRVSLLNPTIDYDMEVYMPGTLSLEFVNRGKGTLYNVSLTFEGEGFTSTEKYVGNVESGQSTTVDLEVTPEMDGYLEGLISANFEDVNGEVLAPRTEMLGFDVASGEDFTDDPWGNFIPPDDYGDGGDGTGEELETEETVWYQNPYILGGAGGGLLLLIIIIVVIVRRRKRKAMEEEYELD